MGFEDYQDLTNQALLGDKEALAELREIRQAQGVKIVPRIDDCDWAESFKYAEAPTAAGGTSVQPGFKREDVAFVVAADDGENDGDDWVAVFLLYDGRFACLRAGCDYTGWG